MIDANYKEKLLSMYESLKPISTYFGEFKDACQKCGPRISSGYLSMDKALNGGFSDELYIMGAGTSSGKSSIFQIIGQNIAESGIDVLYFALEMGKNELIARGISAISYENHLKDSSKKRFTAGNILYWTYDEAVKSFTKLAFSQYEDYLAEYNERYGGHFHVIEGGLSGLCAKDIANLATLYKEKHENRPVVVFVDYLQILKADPEDRSQSDRKTRIDVAVTTLKALASQIGMPVITISSINRNSYNGRIKENAFKESGDTEYTGGVLIGWNWNGVTDTTDEEAIKEEKAKCKKRGYREMTLEVLKYRNSERDNCVHFKYYPAFSYFEEDDGFEPEPDAPFAK